MEGAGSPALSSVTQEHKTQFPNDGTCCCLVCEDLKKTELDINLPDKISPAAICVVICLLPETRK